MKPTSVRIMGIGGGLIWLGVTLIRHQHLALPDAASFWVGILPNLGAPWLATFCCRWVGIALLRRPYTRKTHVLLCTVILLMSILSEVVFSLFLGSPFDIADVAVTLVGQTLMAVLPILRHEVS